MKMRKSKCLTKKTERKDTPQTVRHCHICILFMYTNPGYLQEIHPGKSRSEPFIEPPLTAKRKIMGQFRIQGFIYEEMHTRLL